MHTEPKTYIFPTDIKVRNSEKMLTKGAHNMRNSINTVNLTKINRESMTIVQA